MSDGRSSLISIVGVWSSRLTRKAAFFLTAYKVGARIGAQPYSSSEFRVNIGRDSMVGWMEGSSLAHLEVSSLSSLFFFSVFLSIGI